MRISDWSSDVCSSDLSWNTRLITVGASAAGMAVLLALAGLWITASSRAHARMAEERDRVGAALQRSQTQFEAFLNHSPSGIVLKDREGRYLLANRRVQEWLGKSQEEILGRTTSDLFDEDLAEQAETDDEVVVSSRSEEHTSELQSLMRNSYAVFCLKKKTIHSHKTLHIKQNL